MRLVLHYNNSVDHINEHCSMWKLPGVDSINKHRINRAHDFPRLLVESSDSHKLEIEKDKPSYLTVLTWLKWVNGRLMS